MEERPDRTMGDNRRKAENQMTHTPDEMEKDLFRLGWSMYNGNPFLWQSPDGLIFRGPYKAWCIATGKGWK